MRIEDEFEVPKNELFLLDKVRFYVYNKSIYELLNYIKNLIEYAGLEYKDK